MKTRVISAALLLSLLLASAQIAAAAPSGPQGIGAAGLPFTPNFASVVNKTSGCTASLTCPDGTPISCSSGVPSTCSVGSYFVDCNGARTNCPITCYIERECCDGHVIFCEGSRSCRLGGAGGGSVVCDGLAYTCGFCW